MGVTQDVLRINEETIKAQAARIAELEAELNRAKLYVKLRKAERDVAREELTETTRRLERMTEDRDEWRAGCLLVQQKHQKLSGIVRLALTPDEYHLYRECYEN